MSAITFEKVTKSYGNNINTIDNLELSIEPGEFIALIGPSGCGKTTMLKLINKLHKPDSGNIYINDKNISEWNDVDLRRSIGYVIQQVGLFPHMNIADNISYVLDIKKVPRNERYHRAKELIAIVGLEEAFLGRYPSQLSGGQKQRVGVARALAAKPQIILMDEPFGAVDEITRTILQDEIKKLHSELGKTIVFVTHDIEEAIKLGTRIIVFNKGRIEQIGTKEELIFSPKSDFVKEFMGNKGYLAYLNITKIDEVCKKIDNIDVEEYYQGIPLIDSDRPIIEGIKAMLDSKTDRLAVKNSNNNIIGEFKLNSISNTNSSESLQR